MLFRSETLNTKSDDLISTVDKLDSKNTIFKNITNTVIVILNIGIVLLGGLLINKGVIKSPNIILAFVTFTSSFGSVLALANLPQNLTMTFASGNRVLDLLEEEPLIKDPETSATFDFDHLKVENVEFKYDEAQVLKNINFEVNKNEIIGLLGPSGCGKSTLLNIIGGLDKYTSGDLIINGRSTKTYNDHDWDTYRNHSIGFIFQQYNLISHLTLVENVELALTIAGLTSKEKRKMSEEALAKVGLKGIEKQIS